MKHKKKFKELSFEKRCQIVEARTNPYQDADYNSMVNARRNDKLRKDRVRKKALSAIMKMRNIQETFN
mgnify:CR=1 FL=1